MQPGVIGIQMDFPVDGDNKHHEEELKRKQEEDEEIRGELGGDAHVTPLPATTPSTSSP